VKFNPTRLSIARKRRMLNKKDFAEKIEVATHTAVRWENNQTEPTLENITAFARVLKYPRQFFFGADIDTADSAITSFRSQTAMSAAIRDAALAAGSLGFLISDWIDSKFDLPAINLPDLHLYEPEAAATALRQEWGLGERPISNMIQLLESKGVRVFALAENTAKVNAYSLWRKDKAYVFLNTFKSAESSRFDAAHELAHLILHQDGQVSGRPAEDQANRFASEFLMPKADVLGVLPRIAYLEQLIRAKTRWKVSVAALNYRLHHLGITTEWKYRDLCIEISKRGYNKGEPQEIERETSIVWRKVLNALWAEHTTHLDIAELLAIPETELSTLVFGILPSAGRNATETGQSLSLVTSA